MLLDIHEPLVCINPHKIAAFDGFAGIFLQLMNHRCVCDSSKSTGKFPGMWTLVMGTIRLTL
jgi:hypothetical protein